MKKSKVRKFVDEILSTKTSVYFGCREPIWIRQKTDAKAGDSVTVNGIKQRWRKFSEELPEHHQDVLCYCPRAKFCKVALRRWDEGTKFDVEKQELYTHWRPMPEEPKENDDARKD